ncbi:MAG: hypothetical protein JXB04_13510 [Kiritimatiellae bacterium]|nr:hypothetical protein [Kiritimatiellia bacterium]
MREPFLALRLSVMALCMAAAGTSCRHPAAGRASPLGSGPVAGLQPSIRLIDEPKEIRNDYVYPSGQASQTFAWGDSGGEWRVRPADQQYSYAGFHFRRALDFSGQRETTVLSFRLRPIGSEEHLAIAVADGTRNPPRILVDTPLADHKVWERRGWGLYAIRLDRFADGGIVLDTPDGAMASGPVDWSDIQEVRLITRTRRTWEQNIIIRDMQFGPIPWAMRFQTNPFTAGRRTLDPAAGLPGRQLTREIPRFPIQGG